MNLAYEATRIARRLHAGQQYDGQDYFIAHIEPIVSAVRLADGSQAAVAVAYLHDVVEDTDLTIEVLDLMNFPSVVLRAVDLLTRREEETYFDYIRRIRAAPLGRAAWIARLVKIMDLRHNLACASKLDERDPYRSLIPRWEKALDLLGVDS